MKISNNTKFCGRCKLAIQCLSENITACECTNIKLGKDTSTFLKFTKYDCLCNKCLFEFNALIEKSKLYEFPESRNHLIENVHYYVENGFFVFTELYHVLRGTCCKSGCRHCAYGFSN